jgi:hypothetical protein
VGVCLEALGLLKACFARLAKVHIFSRTNLCYNTGHEFDPIFPSDLVRFRIGVKGGCDDDLRSCKSAARESEERCVLDLSQLLDRIARTPLQGGL